MTKTRKKHHKSSNLDGENHKSCVHIVKITGFIAMVMNMYIFTGCVGVFSRAFKVLKLMQSTVLLQSV